MSGTDVIPGVLCKSKEKLPFPILFLFRTVFFDSVFLKRFCGDSRVLVQVFSGGDSVMFKLCYTVSRILSWLSPHLC